MKTIAEAFEVLKSSGFFNGMYYVSSLRNSDAKCWEITGSFQTEFCRKHYVIATFETADETVRFENLCKELIGCW